MKKTFLLGVGAQKAGTTWLYQYLRGHPECAMGGIKEHAVLNSALSDVQPSGRFADKVNSLIRTLNAAKVSADAGQISAAEQAGILADMDNIAGEFDLTYYLLTFERLLANAPAARLTGDITPEYCMLSADQLRRIRDVIEGAGYDLRVVFLMRDPLDRVYSALRMADRNRLAAGRKVNLPAAERFDTQGIAEWVEQRTRYEVILRNIDAVFAPEQVFLGFYETFFTDASIAKLLEFLGLSHHPANFDHLANASPKGQPVAPDKVETVRTFYDATYVDCKARFGDAFLSEIWTHA